MLYREHISELEVWAQMFDDRFQLGELPSAALIGIIKDMETDYDLNLVAMTLDESIKETLTRIAYENDFPSRSHLTDRVEHMVKLARILRFINRDIMPYTKI